MAGKLSAAKAKNAGSGKHGDGDGLWLHKSAPDRGKWVLLVRVHGRRREMGLGAYPAVSLKEAREEAEKWRAVARQGIDPINERQRLRREAERNLHILADVARDAFESRKAELKEDGKAGRWFSPLEIHVLPKLGKMPVAEIDQIDIRNALAPIWHDKAETARKAINRLAIVMRHAAALGLDVDLQATEKAKALLGRRRHTEKNIPALTWQEVPDFYASLNEQTITHLALRLLILTGVRSRPLRFLHLDQIEADVWTIPAQMMKGRVDASQDFRVPLSAEALAVIELARPLSRDGFLFPSVRKGVISDATMSRFMERRGLEARPHGFRSSLRTWLEAPWPDNREVVQNHDKAPIDPDNQAPKAPLEVRKAMLAHAVGTKVDRRYSRTDYLSQRRFFLEHWADHVTGNSAHIHEGNVVRIAGG